MRRPVLVLSVSFRHECLFWLLEGTEPAVFPPINSKGWRLIHPRVYVREEGKPGPDQDASPQVREEWWTENPASRLVDGTYSCDQYALYFLVPPETEEREIWAEVRDFLARLRYATGQAGLPDPVFIRFMYAAPLGPPLCPEQPENISVRIAREYKALTAITEARVMEAAAIQSAAAIPLYAGLLLDAIKAVDERDFRRAILFAAIAVESMAEEVLAKEYDRFRQATSGTEHLRLVSIRATAKDVSVKDPIYEFLAPRNARTHRLRLHERPLYLTRRSLMLDDQQLYDAALKLQDTRNDLAHGDHLGDATIPGTRDGALEAIDTAIRVFRWFGAQGNFFVPHPVGIHVPQPPEP